MHDGGRRGDGLEGGGGMNRVGGGSAVSIGEIGRTPWLGEAVVVVRRGYGSPMMVEG
jgi:hypothetical protein